MNHSCRFFLLTLSACVLNAQSLLVDTPRHDFGRISNTAKATHGFKITNAGDKDLVLANVRPSCGCTSTVTGKSTLAPGESTSIEATFTPGNTGGRVEKTIQVQSNDPKNPITTLILAAEVLRDLYTDPPGATFFEVPRSGTRELTLRLKSDAGEVKVEGVDAAAVPYATVASRTMGGETFLDVRFDAAKLPKGETRGQGSLFVKSTKGALQVPVLWSLARTFAVTPERIGMQVESGKAARASVRIGRQDGRPFKLFGLEDPKTSRLGLALPEKPEGSSLEATVLIPGNLPPGPFSEILRIRTDDPEETILDVPVNLMILAPKAPEPPNPPKLPESPKTAS